jgi:beta-N-acetylhexosaminidase
VGIRRSVALWMIGSLVLSLFSFPVFAAQSDRTSDPVSLLKQMSLEEKVGQLMMVGFYGSEPNADITRLIREAHAGGVILFAYSQNVVNPVQTARLTNGLQSLAQETRLGVPLLISTDQEGGVVARLTTGATEWAGNMALGATRKAAYAYQAAKMTGEELRAVGINMNLAPDLDVNVNPANPVIGVRSYGENPQLVADMGSAAIHGYQENVIATGKHFPGHGDTNVDSHLGLPVINKSREELEKVELVPFKRAIAEGIDAIMTAHIHVPALDNTPDLPATLSRPILTGLLRQELGYRGLIITDSMTMAGVANYFGGVPKAAVKAVQAGADIILLTPALKTDEQIEVYQAVLEAARKGEIPVEQIDQSVLRILKVKAKYGLFEHRFVDPADVPNHVATEKHQRTSMKIARSSITLVKNENNLLPLHLEPDQKLGIISQFSLIDRVRPYHAATTEIYHSQVNPSDADIQAAVEMAKTQDVLLVGTYNATANPQQVKLVKALQELHKPMVVIAFRNPYDIEAFPDVPAYLTAYGFRSVSLQAAVETVFGDNQPKGRLPVTIPGLYPYGHGLRYDWNDTDATSDQLSTSQMDANGSKEDRLQEQDSSK